LLSDEDILLDLDVAGKAHLFEVVARHFERRHGITRTLAASSLLARESLGSTGLGQGVAIPHARIAGLAQAMGVLARTKFAIPFDAPDGKPVSLFLLLLVPEHADKTHLELLAVAAGVFSDRAVREQLKSDSDAGSVRRLLSEWMS
jgi:PTS system nitrogen regulatory IIA component